ncbi:MAG: HAMP domain-containing histidine kinase [Colwellia sp.]
MKVQKSIRKFILSILSIVLIVLFLIYNSVALLMLDKGIDIAIVWLIDNEVKQYDLSSQKNSKATLPKEEGLILTKTILELPNNLSMYFETTDLQYGYRNIEWKNTQYIVGIKYLYDDSPLYVVYKYDDNGDELIETPDDIIEYILTALSSLGYVLVFSLVLAFILITWMVLHFLRPLKNLEVWVSNLSASNMHNTIPDFSFLELNAVAIPFQQSLIEIENMVSKEQFLLRTTSHELRTPIAVAGTNVELLKRYLAQQSVSEDCQETVQRIERAVKEMQKFTETVLWLGYENKEPLPKQQVVLELIIKELVNSNYYLIEDKDVAIKMSLTPYTIAVPVTPCQMAISNIIRNAMQYTQAGIIYIELNNGRIMIKNEDVCNFSYDKSSSDYGFGLGLILVERICSLMNWRYTNQKISGGRKVEIDFS